MLLYRLPLQKSRKKKKPLMLTFQLSLCQPKQLDFLSKKNPPE